MYYFFYENSDFESRVYNTYEEAEEAWPEVEAEVVSLFGYCDPECLFMAEVQGKEKEI